MIKSCLYEWNKYVQKYACSIKSFMILKKKHISCCLAENISPIFSLNWFVPTFINLLRLLQKKFFFWLFFSTKRIKKNILTLTKSTPSLHFHILVRFQTKINIFRFSCYGYKEQTYRHCIFYIHDFLFNII